MVSERCLVICLVAPAPATLDYGNRTVVNFQRVTGYPFEINTGTRVAVYHISDTPSHVTTYFQSINRGVLVD